MGVALGLTMGGLAAGQSLLDGLASSQQQRSQARQMEVQAQQARNQAQLALDQGEMKKRQIDAQKQQLTREYNARQAHINVAAGAGNVDSSSGSALSVAYGNADLFAGDIQENSYQRALAGWEANQQARQNRWQADTLDANASALRQTADNMWGTVMGSLVSGGLSFLNGYQMGGGKLFDETEKTLWDETKNGKLISMRHPSGKWTTNVG